MKRCLIYLRVSGASQVEMGGFDRQEASCRGLAAGKGFEVVRVFREEGVSGTKETADRPAYQAMLAFVEESGVDTIIVEHLDRLARFYRVQEAMLLQLIDGGYTLYAANTGENITESIAASPMRKFIVQMQGLIAELDRSQTIVKLNDGRKRIRDAGGKAEGVYPYGEDPKRPEEAPVLADMIALRKQGMNYMQISSHINALGYRGRGRDKKPGGTWKMPTVAKILRRH